MARIQNSVKMKTVMKSTTVKPIKGNKEKYLSYRLAFRMINDAIKCECYLQAITIEESIIADRLLSFITFCGENVDINRSSLGSAIKLILGEAGNPKINEKCQNKEFDVTKGSIFKKEQELRDFWKSRCNLLHGIVKSPSGESPKILEKDFIRQAKKTANEGKKLTRWVCDWSKRQINANKKHKISPENEL